MPGWTIPPNLLTVKATQYALEQAINSCCPGLLRQRYPTFYTLATALMRFEQAQDEISQGQGLRGSRKIRRCGLQYVLARYDLEAARSVYADPELDTFQTQYNDLNQPVQVIPRA